MYKIIGGDQTEYGPVSAEQLRQWIAEGRADGNTHVKLEGTTEWRPLRDFPEFAGSFAATPPPMPTSGPSTGYAPPAASFPSMGESGRFLALQQVSAPSIALIITAALGILGAVADLVLSTLGFSLNAMQNNNPMGVPAWAFGGGIQIVIQGGSLLVSLFVLFGAIKMRKLQSHGLCMAASILAMIDIANCCCLIGLPLGIWALVVLSKPEVKQYFT